MSVIQEQGWLAYHVREASRHEAALMARRLVLGEAVAKGVKSFGLSSSIVAEKVLCKRPSSMSRHSLGCMVALVVVKCLACPRLE